MSVPDPIVTTVLFYKKAPPLDRLQAHLEEHIWPQYRFSSTVGEDGREFVPVQGGMDKEYHVQQRGIANDDEIDQFVHGCMAQPLCREHPLWQVTVLKCTKAGRSAVVVRIHHCISDGIGLLFSFLPVMALADGSGGDVLGKIPLPAALLGRKRPAALPSSPQVKAGVGKGKNFVAGFFKGVQMFMRGVLSILVMRDDTELKINAPLPERRPFVKFNGRRTFTRMPPVPTATIKAVRAAHGCTFNDAVMGALTGAIRRYSSETLGDKAAAENPECKAIMLLGLPRPVDPRDPSVSLANNFLTPVFKLPVGLESPASRLRRCVDLCNDFKSLAYLTGIRLTTKFATSVLPTVMMKKLASETVSKATLNVTSVPLPDVPITFFGEELQEVQVVFVNAITQISMLSYNGDLHWSVVADPERFPQPHEFARHFVQELRDLAA